MTKNSCTDRNVKPKRVTLRYISRTRKGEAVEVIEQSIPADAHQIGLALRRSFFRDNIAEALLLDQVVTLEAK